MKRIAMVAIVIIFALSLVGCSGETKLAEQDELAFEYVEKASDSFKDPTSVRILSGSFDDSETPILYAKIMANNSYGANTTSYYLIENSGQCSEMDAETIQYALENPEQTDQIKEGWADDLLLFFEDSALDYDSINDKLAEKWEQ